MGHTRFTMSISGEDAEEGWDKPDSPAGDTVTQPVTYSQSHTVRQSDITTSMILVKMLRKGGTNPTHHVDDSGEDAEEGWDKPDSPCR